VVGYIILMAEDQNALIKNINMTTNFLKELEFIIHDKKSLLVPSQSVTFLGFVIDSVSMTVSMTKEKSDKVKLAIQSLLNNSPVIRKVAFVVGLMVSSFPEP